MNRRQLQNLRDSFDWFAPCGPALIAKVMRNLTDNHPGVRAMFPEEAGPLNERIFATLGQVVRNIERFHKLEGPLGQIGTRCACEGANAAHYRIMREELISVMAELSGADWTDELARDWRDVLEAVSGAMMAGAVMEEIRKAA